jgi:hypothetical protein
MIKKKRKKVQILKLKKRLKKRWKLKVYFPKSKRPN